MLVAFVLAFKAYHSTVEEGIQWIEKDNYKDTAKGTPKDIFLLSFYAEMGIQWIENDNYKDAAKGTPYIFLLSFCAEMERK